MMSHSRGNVLALLVITFAGCSGIDVGNSASTDMAKCGTVLGGDPFVIHGKLTDWSSGEGAVINAQIDGQIIASAPIGMDGSFALTLGDKPITSTAMNFYKNKLCTSDFASCTLLVMPPEACVLFLDRAFLVNGTVMGIAWPHSLNPSEMGVRDENFGLYMYADRQASAVGRQGLASFNLFNIQGWFPALLRTRFIYGAPALGSVSYLSTDAPFVALQWQFEPSWTKQPLTDMSGG